MIRRRTPSAASSLALAGSRPLGIDHHPRRVGPGDAPHRELRIVGDRGADPDHHGIDQRPQPVQVGEPGRAVDVVRMAGWGGDPAVQRLADLADHHQAVGRARPQRPKDFFPRRRQRSRRIPKHFGNAGPGIACQKTSEKPPENPCAD